MSTATNTTAITSYVAESAVTSLILTVILIASIVLNVVFTVVFIRVKYARDSSNYLLLNMAAADLLASLVWLLPSLVSAAAWKWLLGSGFCTFQGVMSSWCQIVNFHTFLTVAIEKFLRFWRPSKHQEVFYKTVVLVLIFGIWVFDLVIALFPVMGWGTLAYSSPQFQCTTDYKESQSHVWFTFVVTFAIPFVAGTILYALIFHRIRKIRSQVSPGKPLVLEERQDARQSYAEKFQESQKKFKLFEVDSNVGAIQKTQAFQPRDEEDPGYGSDDSDDDSGATSGRPAKTNKNIGDYVTKKRKRHFVMKVFDYKLTVTVFIAWIVYQLVWFPQIILTFVWSYNFRPPPADGAIVTLTLVSFFSLVVKPIVYVTNRGLRRSIPAALCRRNPREDTAALQDNEITADKVMDSNIPTPEEADTVM